MVIAVSLAQMLKSFGYTVTSISPTGEMALVKAKIDKPNIILMDIQLSGELNGLETASIIQSSQDVFILFVTAHGNNHIKEKMKEIKRYDLLLKPVEPYELKSCIENAVCI
ncbi:MAG: response regulator [Nitrospirae bacterium]|nr:response regulator [Nitrospirota bacterium]